MSPRIFRAGSIVALLTTSFLAAQEPRLVTAGGGITEIVYAIGMGEQVVGVDSSSVYPEVATRLPQVGYARMLSSEGVLSLQPTTLIMTEEAGPDYALEQLKNAGVEIHKLESGYDVESAIERIHQVAEILDREEQAKRVVDVLQDDLQKAMGQIAQSGASPKVMFIYARSGGILNVSGSGTAASAMIELAGGQNAISGYEGYKPLTAEAAVEAAPDFILMTTRGLEEAGGIDGVLSHPGLALTPAGKNRKIVAMDDLYLLGFGPRLGRAIHDLGKAIHLSSQPVAASHP